MDNYDTMENQPKANALIRTGLLLISLLVVMCVGLTGCKETGDPSVGANSGQQDPTEQTTEAVTEPVVVEMSDELMDFTFILEGEVYQLPCELSAFTDKGWTFETEDVGLDTLIYGISSESYFVVRGEKRVYLTSYNLSGNAKPLGQCLVGGVECAVGHATEFSVAKGIVPGAATQTILDTFGQPDITSDTTYAHVLTYHMGETENNYVRFSDYFTEKDREYSCITMKNFVPRPGDVTNTDMTVPAYLDEYVAPKGLGEDLLSGIICLDNVVYKLPVPLKLLLDQGYEFAQKPEYVVAGGVESAMLQKGDVTFDVELKNFSELQTLPENCTVTGVMLYSDGGLSLLLPNGLDLSATHKAVRDAKTEKFFAYDSALTVSYEYYEYEGREFALRLIVDKEKDAISAIYISCETWRPYESEPETVTESVTENQ